MNDSERIASLEMIVTELRSAIESLKVQIHDHDPLMNPLPLEQRQKRFSGVAYVAGNVTLGLNSTDKPYVVCSISLGTAWEADGPPPSPFPSDEEWFLKSSTVGDIHITRA